MAPTPQQRLQRSRAGVEAGPPIISTPGESLMQPEPFARRTPRATPAAVTRRVALGRQRRRPIR